MCDPVSATVAGLKVMTAMQEYRSAKAVAKGKQIANEKTRRNSDRAYLNDIAKIDAEAVSATREKVAAEFELSQEANKEEAKALNTNAGNANKLIQDIAGSQDLQFLGVDNVIALRGDPVKTEASFTPKPGGNAYAVELVQQLMELNKGQYMMDDVSLEPTDFCVGVAGYPEKHFESMNLATDMLHLKEKVDAGAEYIVTQMFFDNEKYVDFVKKCREIGINCPIVPGIKPITTLKHITFLPKYFNIDFPEALSKELLKCKTNADVKQVGIEWGIEQSNGLKDSEAPCIHFYTMGKSDVVKKIASEVF